MRSAPAPRRAALAAGALALGLALSGCGAGLDPQTYNVRTLADAANSAAGAIAIRNVRVLPPPEDTEVYPAGSEAVLAFTLTNDGPEDDRLVQVSSPDAASVQLVQGDRSQPVPVLELPRLSTTGVQYGAVLRGLKHDLRTAEYVEVTFRFARNGEKTVQAPVATPLENDHDERERSEHFHPIGEGGHGGEGEGEGEHGGEGGEPGSGGLRESGEETTSEQGGEDKH